MYYYNSTIINNLKRADVDWPWWRLDDNPFWEDFNFEARIRMISWSIKLLPYLNEIKNDRNKRVLEIWPNFNPLVTPKSLPGHKILYWENDPYVCKFLRECFQDEVDIFQCDLSVFNEENIIDTWEELSDVLDESNPQFDYVVISHVLNYVDYRSLFIQLKHFLPKSGKVYLNHVVDYGLPQYFNHKRPKSHRELVMTLGRLWFEVEIDDPIEDDFEYHGPYKWRHVIVARVR